MGVAGRVGGLIATLLLLASPALVWAGSAQGMLSVAAVVPARCAVRMPGSLELSATATSLPRETVTMRCTKGTLPPGGVAGVRGPRISRHLILATPTAPRPLAETAPSGLAGPRLVVTVNF
jgi:hypothetical protein